MHWGDQRQSALFTGISLGLFSNQVDHCLLAMSDEVWGSKSKMEGSISSSSLPQYDELLGANL